MAGFSLQVSHNRKAFDCLVQKRNAGTVSAASAQWAASPSILPQMPESVRVGEVVRRVREGAYPVVALVQWRPPQEIVYPVRNPEDDKIVVFFIVHDGNDVAMPESCLNYTIPCFVVMEWLICRKRPPSRKRQHPVLKRFVPSPVCGPPWRRIDFRETLCSVPFIDRLLPNHLWNRTFMNLVVELVAEG